MGNRVKWFRLIVAATAILFLAVFGGCDMLFDADSDNGTGDSHEDGGTLTVEVTGADKGTDGADLTVFSAAVVADGDRVAVIEDWAQVIENGSAEALMREFVKVGEQETLGDTWLYEPGKEYSIVFMVSSQELDAGPETVGSYSLLTQATFHASDGHETVSVEFDKDAVVAENFPFPGSEPDTWYGPFAVGSDYTISGTVTDSDSAGIEGVEISFSGGFDSVYTDGSGAWEKPGLSGSVTVTPVLEGWAFDPESRVVSDESTGVDFTRLEFAGGSGVEGDPYLVANAEQLNTVRQYLSAHFQQVADISLDGYGSPSGWDPIGAMNYEFQGTYDGDGFQVSNLTIDVTTLSGSDRYDLGLFGWVGNDGVITNVHLEAVSITGDSTAGGLAADNKGTITNCTVAGEITVLYNGAGGLVGSNDATGHIENCHANVDVTAGNPDTEDYHVGGLVGVNWGGSILGCSASGDICGTKKIGGLVGRNSNGGIISGCHATGTVTGASFEGGYDQHVGGLVGSNNDGSVIDSHATGMVSGAQSVGGLVGTNGSTDMHESGVGTIDNSYAEGDVLGNYGDRANLGGLVGRNTDGNITNSYAIGNLSGASSIGGLVGSNSEAGQINDCYATGVVEGEESLLGGLVGNNRGGIANCYATGIVQGSNPGSMAVGGLVGQNLSSGTIERTYSTGEVTGESMGGLVGSNSGPEAEASYWDTDSSKTEESAAGYGRTTLQMQQGTPGETIDGDLMYAGWDDTTTWDFGGDQEYPRLQWQ